MNMWKRHLTLTSFLVSMRCSLDHWASNLFRAFFFTHFYQGNHKMCSDLNSWIKLSFRNKMLNIFKDIELSQCNLCISNISKRKILMFFKMTQPVNNELNYACFTQYPQNRLCFCTTSLDTSLRKRQGNPHLLFGEQHISPRVDFPDKNLCFSDTKVAFLLLFRCFNCRKSS